MDARAAVSAAVQPSATATPAWQRDNVLAWCIVPFDARKRSLEERGEMLREIGFRRDAYDFRAEHVHPHTTRSRR
jgi:hypothetical protein